jgi:hypothetical protein
VTASEIAGTLLAVAGCAVCGWLCLFRTTTVLGWARGTYTKSRVVPAYPFSSLVLKPWYPTYLRCKGGFIWLLGTAFVIMLIATAVHR